MVIYKAMVSGLQITMFSLPLNQKLGDDKCSCRSKRILKADSGLLAPKSLSNTNLKHVLLPYCSNLKQYRMLLAVVDNVTFLLFFNMSANT